MASISSRENEREETLSSDETWKDQAISGSPSCTDDDEDHNIENLNSKSQAPQRTSSPNSYDSEESEETLQDPIVVSTALMGENILDSPVQDQHERGKFKFHLRDRSDLGTPRRGPIPDPPSLHSCNPPLTSENANAMSVGIMAQGLAWARRQRDRRQRQYLQHQAEQQLRKIRDAQTENDEAKGRSLGDNPIFQNFMDMAIRKKKSDTDNIKDEENDNADAKISKSGDGYTVELPVAPTPEEEDASWIPPVRVDDEEAELASSPFILSPDEMQQIAVHVLPRGIAYCKWKRLYSLSKDGDSFDACLRCISSHRQTLMVVRTSRDAKFGGFADSPWEPHTHNGACYYGGPNACLFRVDPLDTTTARKLEDLKINEGAETRNENNVSSTSLSSSSSPRTSKVKYYKWTGANRYVQLCDANNKMLAFGGGGDDGAFGLCVEQDFQVGSTGPCATFGNEPLCEQENFDIVDMEIYGFLVGQF